MKNCFNIYRVFIVTLCLIWSWVGSGQTVIYTQDFETLNSGYTASTTSGTGDTDVFNRSNPNIGGNLTFIWAVEDTNSTPATLNLDQIDVSGYSDFTFSIDLLARHYNDWDDNDEMNITYMIDGGPKQNLLSVQATESPTGSNEPAALDLDFDGTGDCGSAIASITVGTANDGPCDISISGQNIPMTFTTYSSPTISLNSNSTLDIEIEFLNLTSTDEGIYLDNIKVSGTVSDPTISVSETSISDLSYEDGSGGPSAEQIFTTSGISLTNDIVLTAPTDFEIRNITTSGPWSNSITLTQSGGNVAATSIGVRLISGLPVDNYTGTLTATSTGATQQDISLNGSVFIPIFEDFNDGDFTANPVWTGNISDFSVISDATIPNGNATSDGSFLASNAFEEDVSLAVESTEIKEWRFSLATPDFDPSSQNYFGVVLMASNAFTGELFTSNFQGYYISIGIDNPNPDVIELWRKDGSGSETWIGDFSTPDFGSGALRDGLDIRITRNNSGEFELFYNTGFEYGATPTTSAGTLPDNTYSTSNYFGVFQNFNTQSSTRRVYLDNIELGNPNIDDDTTVVLPNSGQIISSTIQADATTLPSSSKAVLSFNVSDSGTSDGVATQITQLRLVPGSNNTALWSQVVQGISIVSSGAGGILNQTNQSLSISDTEILVDILNTPTEMSVPDGVSQEYTIEVFLNTTGIIDQQVLQFEIESVTTGWDALFSGSQFDSSFTNIIGNTHTIDVVGSDYVFLTQPVTSILSQPMGLDVEVAYVDSNSNIDFSFNGAVDLTSTGTLSSAIPSQPALNGVATFPAADIVHTVLGTSFVLEASSTTAGFPNPLTSNAFDIISTPELLITEVVDPFVLSGNPPGRYVEIFNAGTSEIDFGLQNYHLVRDSNGGGSLHHVTLVGTIPAKGYYTIGEEANFNSTYGFDPNHDDNEDFATVSGNGNDAYFISTDDTNDITLESTIIDLYGEVGSPSNLPGWEYEDSRAYRNNPAVKNASAIWNSDEWSIEPANLGSPLPDAGNMTPGYGDNDYIFDGSWTNIGLGDPNMTTPTDAQNIFVRSGTASLTQDTSVGDLVVRENAILELEPGIILTVHGDIVNEGTIIFESDDNSTAILEAVQTNSRVVGDGFEIHRRIPVQPGVRSFRYLSSPVTTSTTIYDNWQEGGTTPIGFGTHITGAMGTVGNISSDGFDETETGNPSMFFWNPDENSTTPEDDQIGWTPIPSTNNTNDTFTAGDAYAILIRGDRNAPLDSNTAVGNSTTLRTTGELHYGDFSLDSSDLADQGFFSLVGNPFQSQVNLKALLTGLNANHLSQTTVYYRDPTLGVLGANVAIDLTETDINNQAVPITSDANQYLQPQQAFFVESTGSSPSLTFIENNKNNDNSQTSVFSSSEVAPSQLDITLKDSIGTTYDGLRIVYDNTYSNAIDQYDATKFWNYTDNLSVLSNGNYLSIEKRNIPSDDDVTSLYFGSQSLESYTFEFLFAAENFNAYLVDHYTGQTTAIPVSAMFNYNFNVDPNIPESFASDRFELIYDNSTLSVDDLSENPFRVYPNPLKASEVLTITSNGIDLQNINSIGLFSITGQRLRYFSDSEIGKTDSSIQLKFKSSIGNGTYILKLNTKENSYTYKLIFY